MKHFQLAIFFIYFLIALVFMAGFYYAVPSNWLIDYRSIVVNFECIEDTQALHMESERHPRVTLIGNGEDNIWVYPKESQATPEKRIEWSNSTYRRGTKYDAWDIVITDDPLKPGQYILIGEPQVTLFGLTRAIDTITSEVFTVEICNPIT